MADDRIKAQFARCEASRGTEGFVSEVDKLFRMLPMRMRGALENDERIYKVEDGCVNRFINNVLITVEFMPVKVIDYVALLDAIRIRLSTQVDD